MSALWANHVVDLMAMADQNKESEAQLTVEQLLSLPVDIQDKIINDISNLNLCSHEEIIGVISQYCIDEKK